MVEGSNSQVYFDSLLAVNGQSVDWYLQRLVSLANNSAVEVGITLVVGGSIISGVLIGGKKYFETFAEQISIAWPGDGKEIIRKSFAEFGSIYDKDEGDEEVNSPPEYIHLSNAKIIQSSRIIPNNNGMLWRGKINAISGFSLGDVANIAL